MAAVLVPLTRGTATPVDRLPTSGPARVCPRVTFGLTTFRLMVAGVGCTAAVAVVERLQLDRLPPRGWACAAQHCWYRAPSYETARSRIAEQVEVSVATGPVSSRPCPDGAVEISAREYISCPQARRALARYLVLTGLDEHRARGGATIVNCDGDVATGGYCAVTFPTGAQGHFAYGSGRGVEPGLQPAG
jgi:hypothetical protein